MCQFIETIRIEEGKIYNIDYHTERFNRTRAFFWKESLPLNLSDYISIQGLTGRQKCRIVYQREIEEITYTDYQMRRVTSLQLISSDTIDYKYKKLNREELNHLFAQRRVADDVLVIKNGYITDTSIANVALYDGNTWFTPTEPLLCGTKRAELLDKRLIVEKYIPYTELAKYSQIMLFNAMIDWGELVLPIESFNTYQPSFVYCK